MKSNKYLHTLLKSFDTLYIKQFGDKSSRQGTEYLECTNPKGQVAQTTNSKN